MANILIFNQNETRYIESANTPDYAGDPNVIVNPDLSAVRGVPIKFWKRDRDNVVEMTQVEKNAVLADELLKRKNSADTFSSQPIDIFTALIKVINLRLPVNQRITREEMVEAIKKEIV